jgi:hypothetical protein
VTLSLANHRRTIIVSSLNLLVFSYEGQLCVQLKESVGCRKPRLSGAVFSVCSTVADAGGHHALVYMARSEGCTRRSLSMGGSVVHGDGAAQASPSGGASCGRSAGLLILQVTPGVSDFLQTDAGYGGVEQAGWQHSAASATSAGRRAYPSAGGMSRTVLSLRTSTGSQIRRLASTRQVYGTVLRYETQFTGFVTDYIQRYEIQDGHSACAFRVVQFAVNFALHTVLRELAGCKQSTHWLRNLEQTNVDW